MTLTTKEQGLIADLKSSEEICIQKYNKYSNEACDKELKNLFCRLSQNEQTHLDWLTQIQNGCVPDTNNAQKASDCGLEGRTPVCKELDTFLCKDALSMEKHVSVPMANAQRPAETATAEPVLEPPGSLSGW